MKIPEQTFLPVHVCGMHACMYECFHVWAHVCVQLHVDIQVHMCAFAREGPELTLGVSLHCPSPSLLRQGLSIEARAHQYH